LQRTRAESVARIFPSFVTEYPSWKAIDSASLEDIEEAIRPLGIHRRALTLKHLARELVSLREEIPLDRTRIEALPGVGQYVANAIELFAFHRPRPLLDTNMARIIERYIKPRNLADIRHDPWLQEASHYLVNRDNPRTLNWACLDVGALYCKPRNPACMSCPLRRGCRHGAKVVQTVSS